ncbi:ATP-binding protein [Rhodohalobacter sp.]|uniref:ATP-binding protein n=1 Tax=Rhodohalobacter sp. TaxID=1974210 RepID=UPI002ACEE24F|nr:ATP-binding protein [Rhodohalobacter sp.]MDZ7758092.1 ATP-binding protein [Rhodohalobacter sp.]
MKLKSIKLHPFAGIRDKIIEFEDGLNVLLGPNEAGKSTIYHAILNGLLTTTSLTTTKVESEMGRFFPATGGDVIRVDLELLDEDKNTIRIRKAWKKEIDRGVLLFTSLTIQRSQTRIRFSRKSKNCSRYLRPHFERSCLRISPACTAPFAKWNKKMGSAKSWEISCVKI